MACMRVLEQQRRAHIRTAPPTSAISVRHPHDGLDDRGLGPGTMTRRTRRSTGSPGRWTRPRRLGRGVEGDGGEAGVVADPAVGPGGGHGDADLVGGQGVERMGRAAARPTARTSVASAMSPGLDGRSVMVGFLHALGAVRSGAPVACDDDRS